MELLQEHTLLGQYPVRHYRWPNGLQAFLLHNPISPVAAYLTHYRVGSSAEADHERGLAHFFEHMMFRETARLRDGDFDRIVAECGGVGLNAFTSYDTTAYHVNVPAAALERIIALESDRMVNLRLSPDLIDKERGAVLGEMHMYQDMPSEQLWNTLMAAAFDAHPYRHPVIGYVEQVSAFSQADCTRFYEAHYAPNRAVVVVAGGFDEAAVLALLDAAYGPLAPGAPAVAPVPPDPPWSAARRSEVFHGKISTENLVLGVRTPGMTHPDLPALHLLAGVLTAGRTAPLYQRIVLDGLGTHVSAQVMDVDFQLASPGLFTCEVSLQHGVGAERAEAAIEGVLADLLAGGIPPADFERARNQMRLGFFSGLRTNMSLARMVGGTAVACDDPWFAEAEFEALSRVTPEQVHEVLERYFGSAPRLVVTQRPQAGAS